MDVSKTLDRRTRSEIEVLAAQIDHLNQKIQLRCDQTSAQLAAIADELRRLAIRVETPERDR